jgi:hypothetical protein
MNTPEIYSVSLPPHLTFIRWESEDPRIIFDTSVEPYTAPPAAEYHKTHWNVTLYSESNCTGSSMVVSSTLYGEITSSLPQRSEIGFANQPVSWISDVKSWAVSWTPSETCQITPRVLLYRDCPGVKWEPGGIPEIIATSQTVLISDTQGTTQDVVQGTWYTIKGNLDPSIDMTPCPQYYVWTFSIIAEAPPVERSFGTPPPSR